MSQGLSSFGNGSAVRHMDTGRCEDHQLHDLRLWSPDSISSSVEPLTKVNSPRDLTLAKPWDQPPRKGSPAWYLEQMPARRDMPWKDGAKRITAAQANSPSRYYQVQQGTLVATRGEPNMPQCARCSNGLGKLQCCFKMEGFYDDACGSCILDGTATDCSFRIGSQTTKKRQAHRNIVSSLGTRKAKRSKSELNQLAEVEDGLNHQTRAEVIDEPNQQQAGATKERDELGKQDELTKRAEVEVEPRQLQQPKAEVIRQLAQSEEELTRELQHSEVDAAKMSKQLEQPNNTNISKAGKGSPDTPALASREAQHQSLQQLSKLQKPNCEQGPSMTPATTEIVIRLQVNSCGVFSHSYDKSFLRPKNLDSGLFFDWFARETSRNPEKLKFHFKDALPEAKSNIIERGQDDHFELMVKDIKRKFNRTRKYAPDMREFAILVTDPTWHSDNGDEDEDM